MLTDEFEEALAALVRFDDYAGNRREFAALMLGTMPSTPRNTDSSTLRMACVYSRNMGPGGNPSGIDPYAEVLFARLLYGVSP